MHTLLVAARRTRATARIIAPCRAAVWLGLALMMPRAVVHGQFAVAPPANRVTPGVRFTPIRHPLGAIWLLGDSITWGGYRGYGGNVPGGYRQPLAARLTTLGRAFTFVGSGTDNSTVTLATANLAHHDGHPAYRVDQIINNLEGSDGSRGNNGGYWLSGLTVNGVAQRPALQPNLILLHIGTNDIVQSHDTAHLADRLDTLIDRLTSARPNAILIVATILPLADPAWNATVQAYNDRIRTAIVPKYAALGRRVFWVDQYHNGVDSSGRVILARLPDGTHPTALGYDLMAATWTDAIAAAGHFTLARPGVMVPRRGLPLLLIPSGPP